MRCWSASSASLLVRPLRRCRAERCKSRIDRSWMFRSSCAPALSQFARSPGRIAFGHGTCVQPCDAAARDQHAVSRAAGPVVVEVECRRYTVSSRAVCVADQPRARPRLALLQRLLQPSCPHMVTVAMNPCKHPRLARNEPSRTSPLRRKALLQCRCPWGVSAAADELRRSSAPAAPLPRAAVRRWPAGHSHAIAAQRAAQSWHTRAC
jgi:hypothetical protein